MHQSDHLLTTREAAAALRISASSLHKWRVSGHGPRFVYIGHRVRYRVADIAAYIAEQTRTSTSATRPPEQLPAG
jgi:predicted DNA-binding transcriptional regulator AlpA